MQGKKRGLRILGILILAFGISILLNSFQGITGFVIYEDIDIEIGSILGAIIVFAGILILQSSRVESELESNVKVYNLKRGAKESSYILLDPELYFGKEGRVSLGKFRQEIEQLRKEGGEELVKMVDNRYGTGLHKLAKSGDDDEARVADSFLEVLEPGYGRIEEDENNGGYRLGKDEREEIKHTFRSYDGKLTSEQRGILRKYDINIEMGGKHIKLTYVPTGDTKPLPVSPSSKRTGINDSLEIIRLIEKGRSKEKKKPN